MSNDLLLEKARDLLVLVKRKKEGRKKGVRKSEELIAQMEDFEVTHKLFNNG